MFNPMERQTSRMYRQNPYHHPLKRLAIKGMDGLGKTLENVQHIANAVEATAPMIEKYGPLVKKIPTMYRMMKAIQASEDEGDLQQGNRDKNVQETNSQELKARDKSSLPEPKLYI